MATLSHARPGPATANSGRSRDGCVPTPSVSSSDERVAARADPPVRIRRLPPRPGAGRPRGRRGARHARPHADRVGQVAHLPARGDAAADADARPQPADRADEGSARQAAARSRGAVDADQLLARPRRGGGAAARSVGGPLPPALRRARAAAAASLPRGDFRARDRARRDRRGALREHVGARLPAGLPLHPARARHARAAGDPRDDGDGDAGHGARDRSCARPRAGGRAHERRPARTCATTSSGSTARTTGCACSCTGCTRSAARRRSSTPARAAAARSWRGRCARTTSPRSTTTPASRPTERAEAQEAFIEGRVQTVVATTAFGMGIDKPDIRLVALYNYPESLESYVQMVGRAGRDGRASDTLLLASPADAVQLRSFARSDIPTVADLRTAYALLRGPRRDHAGGARRRCPTRACSSACSSRPASCGAASTPAARCRSRCRIRPPTRASGSTPCSSGTSGRPWRAPTG